MKIFFGGIIQGSNKGVDIHGQNYRQEIKDLLLKRYDNIQIFDPFEGHEGSINYDDDMAKQTFFKHLNELLTADLLIAYLPQASLGTAIEMWEAYNHNIPIISISPMTTNWIIRFVSTRNFETVESFEKFIGDNNIAEFAGKIEEEV
jgi:hypothetical protein